MTRSRSLSPSATARTDFDVLIIGAGISGIGAACHLATRSPDRSFAILEGRERSAGRGTCSASRASARTPTCSRSGSPSSPGRRTSRSPAADLILDYLHETVAEHDLGRHIRFGHRITARALVVRRRALDGRPRERAAEQRRADLRLPFAGTGYFDYDQGFTPPFEGLEDFAGPVVHPQFWPEDLDYAGKRVVIIGSGATAVTIVPAMTGHRGARDDAPALAELHAVAPGEDPVANRLQAPARPAARVRGSTAARTSSCSAAIYRSSAALPAARAPRPDGRRQAPPARRLRRRHPLQPAPTTRGTSACAWCPTATSSRRSAAAGRRSSPTASTASRASGIRLALGARCSRPTSSSRPPA